MPKTRTEYIAYGEGALPAQVPERTRTITAKAPMSPVPDVQEAVREEIARVQANRAPQLRKNA